MDRKLESSYTTCLKLFVSCLFVVGLFCFFGFFCLFVCCFGVFFLCSLFGIVVAGDLQSRHCSVCTIRTNNGTSRRAVGKTGH